MGNGLPRRLAVRAIHRERAHDALFVLLDHFWAPPHHVDLTAPLHAGSGHGKDGN